MQFVFAIVLLISAYVLQALLTKRPSQPKPDLIQDFQFPTTNEGTPQPVIFGDCWTVDWCVLWYGDLSSKPIAGKGGKK